MMHFGRGITWSDLTRFTASVILSVILLVPRGSHADPHITQCDNLAAHPEDKTATTGRVEWDDLEADSAIAACTIAHARFPKNLRIEFQLARAHHKKRSECFAAYSYD